MGSKLKKKKRMTPKGYEDRLAMQKAAMDQSLSEDCYMEVFYSMQLLNFTVLYAEEEDGGFDFTKRKLQNFNKILTRHNQAYDEGGFSYLKAFASHKKRFGFDCRVEAQNFPYRPKMKMYGKKVKTMHEHSIALTSINVAIETYLVLCLHTLSENYRFTNEMIWKWWERVKANAELYVDGMSDEFVIQYFKDECGLSINK